jgi:hypothetical protein
MTSHPAMPGRVVSRKGPHRITTRLPHKAARVAAQLRAELAAARELAKRAV